MTASTPPRGEVRGLPDGPEDAGGQRLDKWLWCARFFKSRTLATRTVQAGRVRVDGSAVDKPHFKVRLGHVLTFVAGSHVRVIRVSALAVRRGPAPEARTLYEDLSPPVEETRLPHDNPGRQAARSRGAGRPTKRDRRRTDRLQNSD